MSDHETESERLERLRREAIAELEAEADRKHDEREEQRRNPAAPGGLFPTWVW